LNAADIRIVSPDGHLVEPADLWRSWLPQRYRDIGYRGPTRGNDSPAMIEAVEARHAGGHHR
jgi:hypothetical protein